ncbi:Ig-like domain-containing protein [Citrobacter portucalensis]|uniref:Ig-like domain-containing protein n=1 Tax=Citrobacter portucalensis TaxID=1639133 RepID=UPI00242AC91E|nr:Ig-like domain-containing protein [Citrobacter portucalensis]WFZ22211.1 Ig-like domain-containing protein [Citrobacter portucalensis]
MQTEIKTEYDAGLPGQLAVLPSFNSAAKVRSCRAGGLIYAGDALKLGDTTNSVEALETGDTADMICGVAVRSHSNFGMTPTRTYGATSAYAVDANSLQGSCEDGPIYVALKSGQAPKNGDLATPMGRNATSNVMEWGVLAADSGQTRAKFITGALTGGVAIIQLTDGALLGKSEAPVISVTGATVAPTTANIAAGATQQLTATVAPADATDKSGAWSSSDQTKATVNASGLVTGVATGTATITFTTTDGGKTANCAVTVTGS